MRVTGFSAAFMTLMIALAASALAQTDRTKPAGNVPQAVTSPSQTVKPSDTGRPHRVPGNISAVPLTVAECSSLGGSVKEGIQACMSGKACQTTGEDKQVHAVCISAAQ
jgi:hypothetical protein